MVSKPPLPEFDFKWPNFNEGFLDRFKVPGVDTTSIMESQKKNFEALTKANQKAAEGYQALMHRQSEILSETIQSIQTSAADLMQANDGRELPKNQAELMEKTIGQALYHMKELAELAISANGEAFKVIQDRAKESIAEMQALAQKLSSAKK